MEGEHQFYNDKSPMQMRQDFKRHCHLGWLTSLQFLYNTRDLSSNHWKASLSGTSIPRGQADVWMYAGLGNTFNEADLASKENERQMHFRNLTSTPATMEKSAVIKVHYPKDD